MERCKTDNTHENRLKVLSYKQIITNLFHSLWLNLRIQYETLTDLEKIQYDLVAIKQIKSLLDHHFSEIKQRMDKYDIPTPQI